MACTAPKKRSVVSAAFGGLPSTACAGALVLKTSATIPSRGSRRKDAPRVASRLVRNGQSVTVRPAQRYRKCWSPLTRGFRLRSRLWDHEHKRYADQQDRREYEENRIEAGCLVAEQRQRQHDARDAYRAAS